MQHYEPCDLELLTRIITCIIINHLFEMGLQLNEAKSEALLFNSLPKWRKVKPLHGDSEELLIVVGQPTLNTLFVTLVS